MLGEEEKATLSGLRFEKRRAEWLAGRIEMKRLLRAADRDTADLNLSDIQIVREPGGAPCLILKGEKQPPGNISISHSNGTVFCAYSNDGQSLGVDLEHIETRKREFIEDYFTLDEIQQIDACTPAQASLYTTLIWSAKEAVLKARLIGLKVDTRSITININHTGSTNDGWSLINFTSTTLEKGTLHLYWRREDEFILTLCCDHQPDSQFFRI